MCDIPFDKIFQLARSNLQQYDSSRLKTVAVVSGTVVALAGLSYVGLRLSRRPKSSRVDSKKSITNDGAHSELNNKARGPLSHERTSAENTLQIANEGSDGKAASSRCPRCDHGACLDASCRDCQQVLYCSDTCRHLHKSKHKASCTGFVQSIDQAILSYLFSRPSESLEKCNAALGRLYLGCSTAINNSTPLAQPLLLDLHGLIQARRGKPHKSIRSFQAALLKLKEVSSQLPDECSTSRDDLTLMNTQGYLMPAPLLSKNGYEHVKARIILHMNIAQLELDSNRVEAAALATKACQEASMHVDDTLAAISLPVRLKAAELQCMWVPLLSPG